MKITKKQAQILAVLQEAKKPMCALEIAKTRPELKEITIHKSLQKLLENDVIRVSGKVQNTRNYARTYTINPQYEKQIENEYFNLHVLDFNLACRLIKETALSNEELVSLQKIIDERIKNG